MNKPTKPNITIPESFAANGVKADFDNNKILNGFDRIQPDVLAGDNLNKFIDDTYKGLNYGMAAADAINLINEGETLILRDGKFTSGAIGAGGLEIGDIGIAPLGIDETKGKRRYLNGQVIIQEQYVQFTNKVKSAVALYPSLACTESEWQTTATMTVGGQVGKFVIDDEAGTIRLPKIIMPIQGLTDLSKLAEIVEAGLPNITGVKDGFRFNVNFYGAGEGALSAEPSGTGTSGGSGGGIYTTNTKLVLDASKSNSIYGKSDTVQQEQIQYPYFIQVATGAETEDNIINEIELNNPFSLLDYKYSEYELNNLSWLRSNGQYNSKAIYPAVYDLLLKIYNGTETKAGVNVKLSTEAFTDYDFVLNTTEETFRLPILTKDRVVVETKTVASATENDSAISYTYTLYNDGWLEYNGRFSLTGPSTVILPIPFSDTDYNIQITDGGSARINYGYEIYNTSTFKIVGSAVGQIGSWQACGYAEIPTKNNNLYFYVGETVQNANLINAGRIEEQVAILNQKSRSFLVERYEEGASWYRVYSDGWCEQGGSRGVTAQLTNVTLLKPYKNANYTCVGIQSNIDNAGYHTVNVGKVNNSTIQLRANPTGSPLICWITEGYIY